MCLDFQKRKLWVLEISKIIKFFEITAFSLDIGKSWLNLQFDDKDKQQVVRPGDLIIDKEKYSPSIMDKHVLDRIQGSMFGLAIGDALGAPIELKSRSELKNNPVTQLNGGGTWGLQKGQVPKYTKLKLY